MANLKTLLKEKYDEENHNQRAYYNTLFQEQLLCDLTLLLQDGTTYQVHKLVLCSASGFFHGVFTSDCVETKNDDDKNLVELDKIVVCETLELALNYIYTGCIGEDIDYKTGVELYKTASYLRMELFKNVIEKYLISGLAADNCLLLFRPKVEELSRDLRDAAINFIKSHCFEFFVHNLEKLTKTELKTILSYDDMLCTQEELLSYVIKWFKHDFVKREKYIIDIIELIKFEGISSSFINTYIINDKILYENKDVVQFVAREQNLRLKKQNKIHYFWNDEKEPRPWVIDMYTANEINMRDKKMARLFDWKRERGIGFSANKLRENVFFFTGPDYFCEYFSNNEFLPLPNMLTPRSFHSTIVLHNSVYCCGGRSNSTYSSEVEKFDLESMKWCTAPEMNRARLGCGLINIDGILYVIGGQSSSSVIERFDPRSDKWVTLICNGRANNGFTRAIVHKNKIFVSSQSFQTEILQLRPKNNYLEIVKVYLLPEVKLDWFVFDWFTYRDDLYLLKRGTKQHHNHCFNYNEKADRFEIFAQEMRWRSPSPDTLCDMFYSFSDTI